MPIPKNVKYKCPKKTLFRVESGYKIDSLELSIDFLWQIKKNSQPCTHPYLVLPSRYREIISDLKIHLKLTRIRNMHSSNTSIYEASRKK